MKKLLPIVILVLSGCYYGFEETDRARAYCEKNGATFVEVTGATGFVAAVRCEKNGNSYAIPADVIMGNTSQ